MGIQSNSRAINCAQCKHNQRIVALGTIATCRALPPAVCCDGDIAEPRFPFYARDDRNWCSAFMQKRGDRRPRPLTSPELIVDGNMETVGTAKWFDTSNSTLSKEAGAHSGSQCLKVACVAGGAAAVASQAAARPLYWPRNGSALIVHGWAKGDAVHKPYVRLDAEVLWTGTVAATWQEVYIPLAPAALNEGAIDRFFDLQLVCGDAANLISAFSLFDDFTVYQVSSIDVEISCWTCKHFQRLGVTRAGECRRALGPAAQCVTQEEGYEPCFPRMFDASSEWCSCWMQGRGLTADLPPIGLWNPEAPPALYPPGAL